MPESRERASRTIRISLARSSFAVGEPPSSPNYEHGPKKAAYSRRLKFEWKVDGQRVGMGSAGKTKGTIEFAQFGTLRVFSQGTLRAFSKGILSEYISQGILSGYSLRVF